MHPYQTLPDRCFWRRAVADTPWRDLQLTEAPRFTLQPQDRVATAGSCFAQHITRHMRRNGLQPFVAEPAHPFVQATDPALAESHGLYAARYGNVYTARQMLELLRQARGTMPMVEDFAEHEGRWFDLLRPGVPAEGFDTLAEAVADRRHHLHCVRRMFETVEVFVFTLGLTECWQHATAGHTYPMCPGTLRGRFEPALHRFHNFTVAEVAADLQALIDEAHELNPALRFIFTVSPVPLVATQGPDHVLVASAYSKAVLRAAVGQVVAQREDAAYFPSFEIVSHPASFGQYLASDLREVTERGVAHVMACFLQTFYPQRLPSAPAVPAQALATSMAAALPGDAPVTECEEVFNEARQRAAAAQPARAPAAAAGA